MVDWSGRAHLTVAQRHMSHKSGALECTRMTVLRQKF